MTERMPTGFANYNGDQTHLAGREEPLGPNYMGEFMWPVTAEYDSAANTTRVGFSLMAPEATS